jgi:hypothetical protein
MERDGGISRFLSGSPVASNIRVPVTAVLERPELSAREIIEIRKQGEYGPVEVEGRLCDIEAGGQVIARGKVVRRRGGHFLKIVQVAPEGGRDDED